MDWFRRNWPDVLIGIALILVIAGIVSTLITGGSPFPFGSGNRPAAPVQTPPPFEAPLDDATEDPAPTVPDETIPSPTVEPLPLDGDAPGDALAQPSVPAPAEPAPVEEPETPSEPAETPASAPQPEPDTPAVTPSSNPSDPFPSTSADSGSQWKADRLA